jgi:hypothetical protein
VVSNRARDREQVRKEHPDDIDVPVIDVRADVKAASVRFHDAPDVEGRFWGKTADSTSSDPEIKAGAVTDRANIPEEVEPGVTYRDVRVRWHAAATISDGEAEEDE